MDFFQVQEKARKKIRVFSVLFWLSIFCAAGVATLLFFSFTLLVDYLYKFKISGWVCCVFGVVCLVPILLATQHRRKQLRSGGAIIARDLEGRVIDFEADDRYERRYINVSEEMAVASRIPIPQLYVLDFEEEINAFSAGSEPRNAVIGVTKGCLVKLSRSELQAVLGMSFLMF